MRVAVISDPHGDLVALRAVVADLEARDLDEVMVAGDLAQGGPQPAEVVDMLVAKAGLEPTQLDHNRLSEPGPWPLRSTPGEVIQLWP